MVNDRLFSKCAIDQYQEKKSTKYEHPKKRLSSYAVKSRTEKVMTYRGKKVVVCGKGHIIDQCKEFMEKNPKERTKILANRKLCFGCYQPMTKNHNAKSCKQRLVCSLCGVFHPTGMYDYMKRKTNEDHDNAQPRTSGTDTVKCTS